MTNDEAKAAIKAMNKKEVNEGKNTLIVAKHINKRDRFKHKAKQGDSADPHFAENYSQNLFVKGLFPKETEDDVRVLFEKYGEITSIRKNDD